MSKHIFLVEAIGHIDDVYLQKYFKMKENIAQTKKPSVRPKTIKWTVSIAACLIAILIAIPVIQRFTQHHATAPAIRYYETMSQVYDDLGYETLYTDLDLEGATISVSYQSDENGQAIVASPLQMLIRYSYTHETSTDKVDYYILFDRDHVDESYIGGYEEQGLTKDINGVTVHYSEIFDGSYHTQAKFVYENNLYVIDIVSTERIDLDFYLELLLK